MITPPSRWLLLLGLTGSLAAASTYAYQRGQAGQEARLAQISALAAQIASDNQQRAAENTRTVQNITHFACLNYRQPADVVVLAQAQRIQARTQALIDTLQLLRPQWQNPAARGALGGPLGQQLARYTGFIHRYTPAATSLRYPAVATTEGWFGQVTAGNLPLPAALATLTRLEAQLRHYEAQALQTQAEKVSGHYDGFDTIGVLAVPTAETMAPGEVYQARLFLGQFSHRDRCNMQMTANGVALTQPGNPGMLVKFAVPARQPGQPDTVRAQWHGTIRQPLTLSDTILQLTVPYLIVQQPDR